MDISKAGSWVRWKGETKAKLKVAMKAESKGNLTAAQMVDSMVEQMV